jgi:hypothetical protein
MRTRNDVRRHQAVTHAFAGIRPRPHRGVHRSGFTAHQHGDVTAADEFASDQPDFRRFRHRVRRLDRRHQTACLDHPECNTVVFACHCLLSSYHI